jgi:RNA-binding protein YhbY
LAHKVENLIERIGEEEWRRFWDSYPRFPDPLYTIIWGKILRILYFKGQVDEESLINEVYSELKDKGYIKEFVEPSVSFNRKMVRNVLCDSIGKDFRKENGKIFILPSREDLKISMARMLETEEREKELLRMVARYIEKDEKKQEKLLKEWWEKIEEERERELWLRP